jgi:hypothetical protein
MNLPGSGQLFSTGNPRYGDNPWRDDVLLCWASVASDRLLPHGHCIAGPNPEISCSNNNSEHGALTKEFPAQQDSAYIGSGDARRQDLHGMAACYFLSLLRE